MLLLAVNNYIIIILSSNESPNPLKPPEAKPFPAWINTR